MRSIIYNLCTRDKNPASSKTTCYDKKKSILLTRSEAGSNGLSQVNAHFLDKTKEKTLKIILPTNRQTNNTT